MKAIKFLILTLLLPIVSQAEEIRAVHMSAVGIDIGTVTITQTDYGLLFTPNLNGLKPGLHGFHVHEYSSCENQGRDAGGHYDPNNTKKHLGPYNKRGHKGDLPALYVDDKGAATIPVFSPKLSMTDMKRVALIVHIDGDNYSDHPKKLGGGGERFACGVIQ